MCFSYNFLIFEYTFNSKVKVHMFFKNMFILFITVITNLHYFRFKYSREMTENAVIVEYNI